MKASTAIFASIVLFVISFMIFVLLSTTFCLATCFAIVGIIMGLVLLIVGLVNHFRAKVLSPSDQKLRNLEPVSGSSLLEPFFAVAGASVRIFRNPRRTMAMLSGIILGTLIISSIFIYTDVLENEMYESMVQGIPYEVSFSLAEPGNESTLWAYADEIANDPRVESTTVFTGGVPGGGGHYSEGGTSSMWEGPSMRLNAVVDGDTLEQTMGGWEDQGEIVNPVFVRDNFSETGIYEKMIGEAIEGTFDLSGPVNATVIPRSMALRMNLDVGAVISGINISLLSYERFDTVEARFENITIVGIFDGEEISWGEKDDTETIFLSTGMLSETSPLRREFREKRLMILAVKIDKDEFDTGDLEGMSGEIDRLVNDMTRDSGDALEGTNAVGFILQISSIMGYILIVIDIVMIVPVVILTIYLLVYGLELSLEERKKEIGILKVQGADERQIFGQVMSESFLILLVGLVLGYLLAIIGAWIISSAVGFMTFNFSLGYLGDFFFFDTTAFLVSLFAICSITLISIWRRGRKFIDLQVSEAVQTLERKKAGFLRRNNIDLILFVYGFISAAKTILDKGFGIDSIYGFELSISSGWDFFLFGFLGTIALWIGGAFSAPVIAKWAALKLEKVMLRISTFRDIGPIVKSGLKRRGDVAKLVFIIALTLSIASLAAIQGYSDEKFSIRELEYQIGADIQVTFSNDTDHSSEILSVTGVREAMSLPSVTVEVLSSSFTVYGIDAENASFARWHDNSFKDESPSSALEKMSRADDTPGVYLGSDVSSDIGAGEGSIITLKVPRTDPVSGNRTHERMDVRVLGKLDHAPGGIDEEAVLADHSTIRRIRELMNRHDVNIPGEVNVTRGDGDIITDHSLDAGMAYHPFVLNVSVDDAVMPLSVTVNWTHGTETDNTSLFPVGGNWMGWIELGASTGDLTYVIYTRDIHNNTIASQLRRVRIGDIFAPNHIIDLSRKIVTAGGTYHFNISLGESLRYGPVRVSWIHGERSGEIALARHASFYTGSIDLFDDTSSLIYRITIDDSPADMGSTRYLVGISSEATGARVSDELKLMTGVTEVTVLKHELDNIGNQNHWGIPGLLTMMFIASLIASLTISFTFSSIIMKKRQREFAVLQTIGASRAQVYKIAIGENSVLMLISVIFGITIGIGLSYMMNGFFEVVGELLGRGMLERLVFIPWPQLLLMALAAFIGMLLAVALSSRRAARQDLSISTRVI